MKKPVVDLVQCIDCDACIDLCPTIFQRSKEGHITVVALPEYPEEDIRQVMTRCLGNCIRWKEVEAPCGTSKKSV